MQHHLDEVPFAVSSAGTGALVGEGIAAEMAVLLENDNVSVEGFTAQYLTEEDVRSADLVIALTRAHRSAALVMYPGALRRTVTLRELARAATETNHIDLPVGEVARMAYLRDQAVKTRGPSRDSASDVDVTDPYGRSPQVFALVFEQIRDAIQIVVRTIES